MGCIVTKEIGNKHFEASLPKYEFELVANGKKKRIELERTISTRHYNVIVDPLITAQYFIKYRLGCGTFSDVFMVEDKRTKLPYAIKYLTLRSLKTQRVFQTESNVIKQLKDIGTNHPFIVNVEDIITTDFSAYIIMELCTGGDLHDKIQQFDHIEEKESARITSMIVNAVQYLHSVNITHRDLKPENVLFYTPGPDSKIVITDFGLASLDTSILNTYCGTMQYCSPELMQGSPYSCKTDIWAVGVITYLMLSGRYPFNGVNGSLSENIVQDQHSYERTIWHGVSEKAKDFINCLLTKMESERYDATQASSHPWLDNVPKNTKVKIRTHRRKNHSFPTTTASSKSSKKHAEFDRLPFIEKGDDIVNSDDPERRHSECTRVIKTRVLTVLPRIQGSATNTDSRRRRFSDDCLSKRKKSNTDIRDDNKKMLSASTHFQRVKCADFCGTQLNIPPEFSKRIVTIKDILDDASSSTSCQTPSEYGNEERKMVIEEVAPPKKLSISSTQLPPLFHRSRSYGPILYNTYTTDPISAVRKHSSLQNLRVNVVSNLLNEQTFDSEKLDSLYQSSSHNNTLTSSNGQCPRTITKPVRNGNRQCNRIAKVHAASPNRVHNPVSNRSWFRDSASSNVELVSKSL